MSLFSDGKTYLERTNICPLPCWILEFNCNVQWCLSTFSSIYLVYAKHSSSTQTHLRDKINIVSSVGNEFIHSRPKTLLNHIRVFKVCKAPTSFYNMKQLRVILLPFTQAVLSIRADSRLKQPATSQSLGMLTKPGPDRIGSD